MVGSLEEVESVSQLGAGKVVDRLTNQEGQLMSVLTGSRHTHSTLEDEGRGDFQLYFYSHTYR